MSGGSSSNSHRQYPMLENCRVVMNSATGTKRPPVRLPQECLKASKEELPPIYDFALGEFISFKILYRVAVLL